MDMWTHTEEEQEIYWKSLGVSERNEETETLIDFCVRN